MSSYEMMKQDLPAYGQPAGGYQQQSGPYQQTVPGTHPARAEAVNSTSEVEHHDPPDNEGAGDEDGIMGPGEIPQKALNVCRLVH